MKALQNINAALSLHPLLPAPWRRPMRLLVEARGEQQTEIEELRAELQRAKARHDEHVAQLHRDIGRLKGVHGA